MAISDELAALYRRDLNRLIQELEAFPDERTLWDVVPGASNSAANLALHLEGNLREFIGRQLGNVAYTRQREREFAAGDLTSAALVERIQGVRELVPAVVSGLSSDAMEAPYPENVLGVPISTRQFLLHLHSHFNYHLGQIDYLRRILTNGAALKLAGL
jgi:hypothetical protein